jgi:hypothetical protein
MPLQKPISFEHLEVEAGALLDALRLDQLVGLEELDALAQLDLDRLDRLAARWLRGVT